MNEGCGGGWPHFHGFFLEHGHMVSEMCGKYAGTTKGHTCKEYEHCKPEAKIAQTRQLGGGWGEVTEKEIMKELIHGGPLTVEF